MRVRIKSDYKKFRKDEVHVVACIKLDLNNSSIKKIYTLYFGRNPYEIDEKYIEEIQE